MRLWFHPRIEKRQDAVRVIQICSGIFYFLAAANVVVAFILFAAGPQIMSLPPDAIINYLGTGIITASVASALRAFESRTAAIMLLLVSLGVAATTIHNNASHVQSGNLGAAVVAIITAIEAIRATVAFQGRLAEQSAPSPEPTVAPSPPPRASPPPPPPAPKPYDVEKWEALMKYDDDIAMVVQKLRPLGQKWIDELAKSYLAINDKKYLLPIVQKIIKAARDEGTII